jgi:hypothetical protein
VSSADETVGREIAYSIGFKGVFPYMGDALARLAQDTAAFWAVRLRRM